MAAKLLGDLIEIHNNKRVPLSSVERADFQGEYPYYGAQSIVDYVADYRFDGEFLLVAEDGENLRSRKSPIAQIVRGKFWVNNHAHVLTARQGIADVRFLEALLNSFDITAYVTGAAQPKLSMGNLRNIAVTVPDYQTQAQLGRILSNLSELETSLQKQTSLLEEAARLIYTEWFVRLRFPGHEKTASKDGIPEGWNQEPLGQRVELNYGKSLKESDRQPGEVPVFGSSGIVGSHTSALSLGPGIIVGRKGNVGSIFYSPIPFFAIDTVYFVSTEQTSFFLLHTLQRMNFISSDAAVPGLNRNHAYSQPVTWPSDSVLSEFEATCRPIYEQITTLEKQIAALKSARDLLLPRLISGQLRL
jgi:type I restriction enzyme, S subunit